ncbi:cobalamin biosynthesis protein CobG [Streptomyces orinoci]|uniref:Cobalamin biosynthesis protein CobG n=1 Tax=Streptomyces orinoci TaxID=67339 RepID=A0ABV3JRZ6_STRON|nr:cobalamin biosynthesis protein CobG [Streptomyces orinoci]
MPVEPVPPAHQGRSPGGDACPGALRLHSAADGALARIRIPAGLLTSRQAIALADAADDLGDGHFDLTSRGNLQLRGLASGCGAELGARLRGAGLLPSDRHDRVRNVAASPLCGLDGQGMGADVQRWARTLDALLCSHEDRLPELSGLSGRFLFGLDDGRGDITALSPDVTLIATSHGRAALRLAATGPALELAAEDAPRAALLAAAEFLAVLRTSGIQAWRIHELPRELLPAAETLAARLAIAGIATTPLPRFQPPHGSPPRPGMVTAPDHTPSLSVAAPLGRLTTAQWRLLADVAGRDELRVTPWRGIVLPGTDGDLLPRLAAAGLVTSADSPWHRAGACAGRPGCAKSLADVRADAAACLASARPGEPGGPVPLPVYWSGCERRCGHPADGDWVDVLATGDGYRVTAGGRTTTVASSDLAGAVATARIPTR